MGHILADSYLSGSKFTTISELRFKQRTPIPHKGVENTYDTNLITSGSIVPSDYDLPKLFNDYSSRNCKNTFSVFNFVYGNLMTNYSCCYYSTDTAILNSDYTVWSSGRPAGGRFKVEATVKYPEETVIFYTGFWQMMKYALTQYIAILLVFAFLCERLKIFVFSHQIVNTVPIKPFKSA